jgi:SAM-dependent methyltransferase
MRRTDLLNGQPKRFLHVAPECCLSQRLQAVPHLTYISGDHDPALAMTFLDLTDIKFPNGYFDAIFCSHVLEHVLDDRKAMRELRRVMAPRGWAVVMVPITAPATYEDARITDPSARAKAFGQRDHVRRYGPDFVDRLKESAFEVEQISPEQIVRVDDMRRMAIAAGERIFFCRK